MCLIPDTNNSRLVNRTNENWRLDTASSATSVRNMLANTPKLCPVRTSTRSNKIEPRNPNRKKIKRKNRMVLGSALLKA
jgi:ABC-type anion transport system duplicated permease subunit